MLTEYTYTYLYLCTKQLYLHVEIHITYLLSYTFISFEFGYVQSFEVEGLIHILNLQGAYAILLTEGNLM